MMKTVLPSGREEILAFLEQHKAELEERFHISLVALFGSLAQNKGREENDVDLLYDLKEGITDIAEKKEALRDYLEKRFHRKVDLCSRKYLKPYAKEQVLAHALYLKIKSAGIQ